MSEYLTDICSSDSKPTLEELRSQFASVLRSLIDVLDRVQTLEDSVKDKDREIKALQNDLRNIKININRGLGN